jgi:SEC-C motif-containing protein
MMQPDPLEQRAGDRCPCASGASYGDCCGPLHDGGPAETAVSLMRSRFSAFALGMPEYLLRTWHSSARSGSLELEEETVWRRLQIVDTVAGGPGSDSGVVEFRDSFRSPAGAGVLHERSRFTREHGAWRYVDGDVFDA